LKYSIVASVSNKGFGPVVFKGNLKASILKAKKLGYEGIELAIKKPDSINLRKLEKLVNKHDLEVVAIGTGQIYSDYGLSFSDSRKSVRREAIENVKKIIDIASCFNSKIIIGLIRGKIDSSYNFDKKLEIAEKRIYECLSECLSYHSIHKVDFLLEPINRYETNIFNTLEDVSNFLERYEDKLEVNRIGILADTFHMNIEEPVIHISIEKYINLIKHVHFADSNRLAPGFGHIDFHRIIEVLKKCCYQGYISFEILPLPDPETSAKKALEFVKAIELK
jgi:sugar phosphate isomerase/epimerase